MKIYWALFGTILLIQIFPLYSKKIGNIKLLLSFFLIFIYGAIRVDFGRDYKYYESLFYAIKVLYVNYSTLNIEPGFYYLNLIIPSHRGLLILLSAFTAFTYYWLFKRYIPYNYHWLGFCLMALAGDKTLFFQLSGLRNAIALNIMAFSIKFIEDRKLMIYGIFCLIAYSFHRSAILIMPVTYFLAKPEKFKLKDIIIWTSVILTLAIARESLLISFLSPIINNFFNKYQLYLDFAMLQMYERSIFMYIFVFVISLFLFFVLNLDRLQKTEYVMFRLSLLYLIAILMGSVDIRTSQYFVPFFLVGTIMFVGHVRDGAIRLFYIGLILLYLAYSFFHVFMGNINFPYSNYNSIFN
jgi:hypothetical protein